MLGYWPPARGRTQFLRLLEALYNVQAQPVEADYAAAMQYLRTRQRKRSFVILFTDVLDRASAGSLVSSVGSLAPRHLPLIVAVGDPAVTRAARAVPSTSAQLYEREVAGLFLQDATAPSTPCRAWRAHPRRARRRTDHRRDQPLPGTEGARPHLTSSEQ